MSGSSDCRIFSSLIRQLGRYPRGTKIRFLTCSPDGSQLALAGGSTTFLFALYFPSSTLLPGDSSFVSVVDIHTPRKVLDYPLPVSTSTLGLAWIAPSVLALLSSDGYLRILTLQRPVVPQVEMEVHTLTDGTRAKGCLAASQDGSLLATCVGAELKLWRLRNESACHWTAQPRFSLLSQQNGASYSPTRIRVAKHHIFLI